MSKTNRETFELFKKITGIAPDISDKEKETRLNELEILLQKEFKKSEQNTSSVSGKETRILFEEELRKLKKN